MKYRQRQNRALITTTYFILFDNNTKQVKLTYHKEFVKHAWFMYLYNIGGHFYQKGDFYIIEANLNDYKFNSFMNLYDWAWDNYPFLRARTIKKLRTNK